MIGFTFYLWSIALQVILSDLLDKRYNSERTIHFIPGISFSWLNEGEGKIFMIILSWLNLELSFIIFDMDYWADQLEEQLKDLDKNDDE